MLVGSALLPLVMLGAPSARAAVITVTTTADGGPGSLRAAFDTANANAELDEIVLAPGATYELTQCGDAAEEDANADGDLDHTSTDALTIRGNGSTVRNTCPNERIFELELGSGTFTIENATLTDGDTDGDGGAIEGTNTSINVTNTTVSGNESGIDGGGVETSSGDIAVTSSLFTGNSTTGDGGGLRTGTSIMSVTDSLFVGNVAGVDGGAMRASSGGSYDIVRSTFASNQAGQDGGGLRFSSTEIRITSSTLSGNSAMTGDGGGVRDAGSSVFSVVNSTFSGNSAGDEGGGMWTNSAPLSLNNATVTGNTAPAGNGGGIGNENGTTTLSNTIVGGNPGGDCATSTGAFSSGGNNIASDASCNLGGPGDLPSTDPKLGPLAENGGSTQTHALLKGSPAIGGGNDTIARGGPACEPTDQRGLPR
ncbi:MAG: choice-of-anchor Q domain-containing protein, partial [Actinomycetota bacterium]